MAFVEMVDAISTQWKSSPSDENCRAGSKQRDSIDGRLDDANFEQFQSWFGQGEYKKTRGVGDE